MTTDSASILEAIKRGGLEASLFTTFNATIPFYEDVLLRKLTAGGCRNNVVLMDRQQCAMAYASEATRPRLAGIAYTLVPIQAPGAFHPKLGLLAGKKRASLFVGSHNLTISGFGYNREVTNHVDMAGSPGAPERSLMSQTWAVARTWISELSGDLPSGLLASAYSLDEAFGTSIVDELAGAPRLIAQHPGGPGMLDQLEALVSPSAYRITVIGAFFDRNGIFLSELARRWTNADIVVGIDPSTVWMPGALGHPRLQFVDAVSLGHQKVPGYLHAKAVYFEERKGDHVFVSGSANPSAPAWLTTHERPNVEAMLVRSGRDATSCAGALGMDALWKKPAMTTAALAVIERRSHSVDMTQGAACPPLYVGIADHDENVVRIRTQVLPAFDAVDVLGENDRLLASAISAICSSDGFQISQTLMHVRTLVLRFNVAVVARLLVHHPTLIANRVNGAARESATALLVQLGSDFDDISRVLPLLERIIFSDSVSDAVRAPAVRSGTERSVDSTMSRPQSLGISLTDISKSTKPTLFSRSNDLAYLIDILVRRIGVQEDTAGRGVDRAGRTEEEQVGQDDEDLNAPLPPIAAKDVTDARIAELVRNKATKLVRRMGKALRHGDRTPQSTRTLVVQLVGVLALLRELIHLEMNDRWRHARTPLVWIDDLKELLDVAASTLFPNGSHALQSLTGEDHFPPEEVQQLRPLLLWLTWMTKREWCTPKERHIDDDGAEDRAITNAQLLELLRHVADDSDQWAAVRLSIDHTLPPHPIAAIAAERWFARHQQISQKLSRLSKLGEMPDSPACTTILLGDIVQVPGVIDIPSIAVGNDGRYVSVHVGDNKPRHFHIPRVRWMARL